MKPRLKLSVLTFKQYFNNENNIFSLNVVSHQENNKNETSTESIGENNTKSSFERDNKTLFEAGLSEDNKTMFQNGIQSYSNRNELKNDQCEGGSDETNEENTINKSGCSGESQESYRFKMNDSNQTVNWNSKNKIQYNLSNLIYGGQNEGSRRGYNIRDDEGSRLLNSGPNKDHFVRFQRDQISNRHGNQQSFSNQKNEHQTEFVRPGDNENTKNKGQFESKHSCSRDTRGFQRDGRNQIGKFRGNQDNKNPCGANNFRGDQHNQNPGGASNFRGNQHNKNPGGANNVRASQHNQNHGGANNFRGNQKYQHFSRENVEKQGNFHHGNSDYRSDQDQPRPYQNGYQFRKGTSFTKPNFIYQECRPTSVQSDYQDYSNMERPNSSQSDYLVGQRNVQFNKLNSRSNQASREDLSQNPNQRMNRNPHGFNRGHYNNFGNNRGFNRPNSSYNHSQNHVPNRGNFHGHSRGSGSVNQFNPRFNSSVVNDCNPPGTANTGRQEDQSRLRSRRGAKILIFDSRYIFKVHI